MFRAGDDKRTKGGRDCISALPDDVLLEILSLLPLKEAICTCVLSSRWENLWKRIPRLNFVAGEWIEDIDWYTSRSRDARTFILCVNRILRSHQVQSLEEFKVCFDFNNSEGPEIDDWLQFLIAKKVPRLDFDLYGYYNLSVDYDYHGNADLPRYYADSYVLRECFFRRSCIRKGGFKFLTSLSLKRVNVTSKVITYFLRNAPFLELLVVHGSDLLSNLMVCGPSIKLKHLEVCHCHELGSLKISAPNLTSLKVTKFEGLLLGCVPKLVEVSVPCYFDDECNVFKEFSSKVYKIALPSLSRCLSQLKFLALRSYRPLKIKDKGMIPELPRLKKLDVVIASWADQCLLGVTSLINAAPKLEEFALQLYWNEEDAGRELNVGTAKPSSHNCLKVVEFIGYLGRTSDFELLKYFIENCPALDRVEIYPHRHYHSYFCPISLDEFDDARDKVKEQLEGQVPGRIQLTVHTIW